MDLNYISELLQAILLAILPVLAVAGVRWLLGEVSVAKAKLTNEQQAFLANAVKVAVLAAEQFGLVARIRDTYFDKRNFAIQYVTDALRQAGMTVNVAEITAQIEAAVLDEFNRDRYLENEKEPNSKPANEAI
jgi:hypothetical protein